MNNVQEKILVGGTYVPRNEAWNELRSLHVDEALKSNFKTQNGKEVLMNRIDWLYEFDPAELRKILKDANDTELQWTSPREFPMQYERLLWKLSEEGFNGKKHAVIAKALGELWTERKTAAETKARKELGRDYNKAEALYLSLYTGEEVEPKALLATEDFYQIVECWQVLGSLANTLETEEGSKLDNFKAYKPDELRALLRAINAAVPGIVPLDGREKNWSRRKMAESIQGFIDRFHSVDTKPVPKKAQTDVFRMDIRQMHLTLRRFSKDGTLVSEFQNAEFTKEGKGELMLYLAHLSTGTQRVDGTYWTLQYSFNPSTFVDVVKDSVADKLEKSDAGFGMIVKNAESGLSRMLDDLGYGTLAVARMGVEDKALKAAIMNLYAAFFNADEDTEESAVAELLALGKVTPSKLYNDYIEAKKHVVIEEGVTNEVTHKLNLPIWTKASQIKKGALTFGEAASYDDVFNLWFQITKLNASEFADVLCGGAKQQATLCKMLTRLTSRGSASWDVSKLSAKADAAIREANVKYVDDTKITVSKAYMTVFAPFHGKAMEDCFNIPRAILEGTETSDRSLTLGDGQCLADVTFMAKVANANGKLSDAEYVEFLIMWNRHSAAGGTLETAYGDRKLRRLINQIPTMFQFRHGAKKGTMVMADLHNWLKPIYGKDEKPYDLIVPESVRKFNDGDWSNFPLEILNWSKDRGDKVTLNTQVINALWNEEDPFFLVKMAEYWVDECEKAATDADAALAFANVAATVAPDDETASLLERALASNKELFNETRIQELRYKKIEKCIKDMMLGHIIVPGKHAYMVCDPKELLNSWFADRGLNLKSLNSGEFFFADRDHEFGRNCEAGGFRNPLTHPSQAQRLSLVIKHGYWFLRDVLVFNGKDGIWDNMGGADFDGDSCIIIFADNEWGRIIVASIRTFSYDVWENVPSSPKQHFVPDTSDTKAMQNLFAFYMKATVPDRVGLITDWSSFALDISNHLKSLAWFAKKEGCDMVRFLDPCDIFTNDKFLNHWDAVDHAKSCLAAEGLPGVPVVQMLEDGRKVMNARAVVNIHFSEKKKKYFSTTTFDGIRAGMTCEVGYIEKLSNMFLDLCGYCTVLACAEIDGSKNGWYAEGPTYSLTLEDKDNRMTDEIQIQIVPYYSLFKREDRKGSEGGKSTYKKNGEERFKTPFMNSYHSMSPMGLLFEYLYDRFYGMNKKSVDMNLELKSTGFLGAMKHGGESKWTLLTQCFNTTEKSILSKVGKPIFDKMLEIKSYYNSSIRKALETLNEKFGGEEAEDGEYKKLRMEAIEAIKQSTLEQLNEVAHSPFCGFEKGIPTTIIAALCYWAAYQDDPTKPEGKSFGWLFADRLLELFSRRNESWTWVTVPEKTTGVSVRDNVIYITNGNTGKDGNIVWTPWKAPSNFEVADVENTTNIVRGVTHLSVLLRKKQFTDDVVDTSATNILDANMSYRLKITGIKYVRECHYTNAGNEYAWTDSVLYHALKESGSQLFIKPEDNKIGIYINHTDNGVEISDKLGIVNVESGGTDSGFLMDLYNRTVRLSYGPNETAKKKEELPAKLKFGVKEEPKRLTSIVNLWVKIVK